MKKLMNLFNIVFFVTSMYLLKIAILDGEKYIDFNIVILVGGSIVLLTLLYLIRNKLNELTNKYIIIINIIALLILIGIQIVVMIDLSVIPSWDFEVIHKGGDYLARNNELIFLQHFKQYPNNLPATILMGLIFKIAYYLGANPNLNIFIGIIFNIVIIDIALVLGFFIIKIEKGIKVATIFSIFTLTITPIYMYTPIFYTDTLSIVYPVLIVLMYILFKKTKNNIFLLLLAISCAIGTLIKTNVIIAVIALIIFTFFVEKFKNSFKIIVSVIISFIVINSIFNSYVEFKFNLDISNMGFPPTHWIMMGLKDDGGYDSNDVLFTAQTKPEDRVKENIRIIKERISNFGVKGTIGHINNKIKVTWSDGTLYAAEKLKRNPINESNILGEYIYGENNKIYVYISQISFISLLFGIVMSVFYSLKNMKIKDTENLLNINIFGVFLFLIIWETRSRYLMCFLIIMMISSIYGLDKLFQDINRKKST